MIQIKLVLHYACFPIYLEQTLEFKKIEKHVKGAHPIAKPNKRGIFINFFATVLPYKSNIFETSFT